MSMYAVYVLLALQALPIAACVGPICVYAPYTACVHPRYCKESRVVDSRAPRGRTALTCERQVGRPSDPDDPLRIARARRSSLRRPGDPAAIRGSSPHPLSGGGATNGSVAFVGNAQH